MRQKRKKLFLENFGEIKATILKRRSMLYMSNDFWILAKGYRLYKYDIAEKSWNYFSRVKDPLYAVFSEFFLTKRLFRAEITNMYCLKSGAMLCIAKKGIFKYNNESRLFHKCYSVRKGSRPLSLCVDNNDFVYFGEYFSNTERNPIHIYKSEDEGNTWQIAYTFPKGTINHIHGIFRDPYTEKLWYTTGDIGNECIIGYSDNGFNSVVDVFKGDQGVRACILFFYKDRIVYCADSEYENNYIREINRETKEIRNICQVEGPCIYGTQAGDLALFSTSVEPSKVNKDKHCHLWYTVNGKDWHKILSFRKDPWEITLFEFGTFFFPNYDIKKRPDVIACNGRAIKYIGGSSLIFSYPFF